MQFAPFSFLSTQGPIVPPPYDNIVTSGLYMDFRQSEYTSGSLIWSSSAEVSSSISGAMAIGANKISSSVYMLNTSLTATYISASEAHSEWTVVIYSKYDNIPQNGAIWERNASGLKKRFVHNGPTDRYWIINSSGTDFGLDEVSGSTWLNSNFFVDTLVGTGSSFIQYQNEALTQNNSSGTTSNVNWATNGGNQPFAVSMDPSYVKRILVYNRGLTANEVIQNYNALTGSNN